MNRPPFDGVRAAFWLVASIIASEVVVVLAGVGMCLWYAPDIVAGHFHCDANDKLSELMAEALAAALGFAGGFHAGRGGDSDKE